ncbi:TIGR02452 family protein [Roseimicrobium sp. ORNL1]|uniref:TIGR02452 family protein n=1 Tax=Roseimicrobium sp. ORNL1 TaxID=2711231 RepID=UPI0013E1AF68|nr:TIGR02452 family protein [Roseimicrobium sp. ORNL1]QIF00226.1 TIGR02452 family protein [Roseimicrobium sp. ORNL1]
MITKRSARASLAEETLRLIEQGGYTSSSGKSVDLAVSVSRSVRDTVGIAPEETLEVARTSEVKGVIEVTSESTLQALIRLQGEDAPGLACLNFASAKNAGGGFLGGSQAQEESLARSSALYPSLTSVPQYYEANRACRSSLYTDWMIWSPEVPFFRDDEGSLLDVPVLASVITAPAPNAGAVAKNRPDELPLVEPTLQRRAERVLQLAASRGVKTFVLGAWGCGVFRNDPSMVASVFADLVREGAAFANVFPRLVFAIYDTTSTGEVLTAFKTTLLQTSS